MNFKIRLYPRIKALRIFKGRFIRSVGVPFLNILRTIQNLEKSILSIRYYLRLVNKEKIRILSCVVRLAFIRIKFLIKDRRA